MKQLTLSLSLLFLLTAASCSDDSIAGNENQSEVTSKYVVAASPNALDDVADYLLTANSLSGGSVSTLDNGIEQDGTYRYYATSNNKFFSLLWGNRGSVTTYQLNSSGELEKITDFQSESVRSFAPVGDEIFMFSPSLDISAPFTNWYRLDTQNSQFVDEGQINTKELATNGGMALFTGITKVDDKAYFPFSIVTGQGNNPYSTNYPDSSWVAVYSYPEMKLQTIIKDGRTSSIGRYFTKGLYVDENGDVYAFSSSLADNNNKYTSTQPSAVTRINSGELQFDPNYFFNLEEASGGYVVTNHIYAGDGKAVVFMGEKNQQNYNPYMVGKRLAVINLYDQTFTWVKGLPDPSEITNIMGRNNYASEDGSTAYTGITTKVGSYVYAIDIATATAERGLHVEGGEITAIHKLKVPQ